MASYSQEGLLLEALFDHLVLPPKLSAAPDDVAIQLNWAFAQRLIRACRHLHGQNAETPWKTVEASLLLTKDVLPPIPKERLVAAFLDLTQDDTFKALALHVTEQNAAIIIYKRTNDVVFETFEASASTHAVLETNNALRFTFPCRSVAIPVAELANPLLQEALAEFIEQATETAYDQFAARASKGGALVVETRDTCSPALITEMLFSFLEATGKASPIHPIHKRVRDDVVLGSAERPWRRSPFWLMLRVFVHRIVLISCQNDRRASRISFKLIMCVVLSHFLSDCQARIQPEKVLMLQAKLCRRLAKLQTEIEEVPIACHEWYAKEFGRQRAFFEATVAEAKRYIAAVWNNYRKRIMRRIPLLPWTANQEDMVLKLANSGQMLKNLLSASVAPPKRPENFGPPFQTEGTVKQVNELAARYSDLVDVTKTIMPTLQIFFDTPDDACLELSRAMTTYMDAAKDTYTGDAILASQYLLILFELWVAMDSAATKKCPILQSFHPGFVPEALDLLCFMTKSDMKRLRLVQHHIGNRIKHCNGNTRTIFSDPDLESSFAASYMQTKSEKSRLELVMSQIDKASAKSEKAKKRELDKLMAEYETLSAEIKSGTCFCKRQPDGSLDVRGCKRCYMARCRYRLRIQVHEAFLPQKNLQRAAILLELKMPRYLAAYRDATWRLQMLGRKTGEADSDKPAIALADFGPLEAFYDKHGFKSTLTLASRNKSYFQTHFRKLKLPTEASEVLLPFGPRFTYYDLKTGTWLNECSGTPWYQHLLGPWLPQAINDPFSDASLYMRDKERPSSYEIAASQDECPRGMHHHEFTAYQTAMTGTYRRWMAITLELGSTNLNFSSSWTLKFLSRLALQSGPQLPENKLDAMGKIHFMLNDVDFCSSLAHQIRLFLKALESGRRDLVGMSMLVMLTLRLLQLGPESVQSHFMVLLQSVRRLLSLWISQFCGEVRSTGDGELACKAASSAFRASLLCRQTFRTSCTASEDLLPVNDEALHFFRASIALSESAIINLDAIPKDLQQLLAQDMTWTAHMSTEICEWTLESTSALESIINETWVDGEGSHPRSFSEWTLCGGGEWLTSTTNATTLVASQIIHYHPLRGHLLIDGKALGRLPLNIRQDAGILELFQSQHLLTRSSGVAGMEYHIVNGSAIKHEVHVGFREEKVVIRARFRGSLLEYIPREVFRGDTVTDFPTGLIDGCVHWLNLQTGELEIRRKPGIWHSKLTNWVLNVRTHIVMRGRTLGLAVGRGPAKKGTCLVEPQSEIGKIIADIFRHFEDPGNLTIFQPLNSAGRLSVEIKRLEMRFFVNDIGLLESEQLKSEINPVQDVGTFHGLLSKIVLRNTSNPERKSIMVPMGPFFWQKEGPHVTVRIKNDGIYALFSVDSILGRLNCAPEPALFYLKALIHALTSFPLPDDLTGRTGSEEACLCLTAAQSQPWKPLNMIPKGILSTFEKIGPKREYYPSKAKLYQRVFWDESLTATIQHEQLRLFAAEILRQSETLEMLAKSPDIESEADTGSTTTHHLTLRGILRRQIYERLNLSSDADLLSQARKDCTHHPRGVGFGTEESIRVYQTVKQLRVRSSKTRPTASLCNMLRSWNSVEGFNDSFSALDIARNLSTKTPEAFGPLVQLLRSSNAVSNLTTQLSLALFAFGTKCTPLVISWLVAVATSDESKEIAPPGAVRFTDLQACQSLDATAIKSFITSCHDIQAAHLPNQSAKKKGKKVKRSTALNVVAYRNRIEQEAEKLAAKLEILWPDIPLTRQEFDEGCEELALGLIDTKKTWDVLEPEMQRLTQNNSLLEYAKSLELLLCSNSDGFESDLISKRGRPTIEPVSSPPTAPDFSKFRVPFITELLRCCRDEKSTIPLDSNTCQVSSERYRPHNTSDVLQRLPEISSELSMLSDIVQPFKNSTNIIQQQYGQDLEKSIEAMAVSLERPRALNPAVSVDDAVLQIDSATRDMKSKATMIHQMLAKQSACHLWLQEGRLWPCDSLTAMLKQLCFDNYKSLSPDSKDSLISFGLSVSRLQHLQRINDAILSRDGKKLREETVSWGHSNWSPTDYPEWLLLEIDNNILIRTVQVDVAKLIISPQSNENSVLQMNMGTGKTSVVIPMAAIALADMTKLCRVVVPKSLLLQTAQVLQSRIGGLIGRRVRHIPFSRRSPSNGATLSKYHSIHDEMLQMGGVMLCLPEHILSFKLSGLQRLADRRQKEGRQMMDIQAWLDSSCRDILDESDMTLSVYTQLIYPSGKLATLDGHSYRWLVVEQLLGLVEGHSSNLQKAFEGRLVVVQRACGYPIFYFITQDPEDALNELLVHDVCSGRLPQVQIRESADVAKEVIRKIVSGAQVSASDWDYAIKSLKDESFGPRTLYLLRGLISQRILVVCLKKKWNIQYGLHPERQPIAVPFEAKGIPSQSAEYGHPDTTLILTCLAFYQQGLSKEQLKQGLQSVMQSDDAVAHYDRWICSCTALPDSLRHWNMLDPENDSQVEELWRFLRFDRNVINHHLNTYIFPRYAKQYPVKLSASGWDIPLLQQQKDSRSSKLTTGFSGTNDNKRILPQTIRQNDSPRLLHTNAEVLCHLLESRNSDCHLTMNDAGVRFDEQRTLCFLREKKIRVLIDAGAHILEMENQDVAKTWLNIDAEAQGAVYFGSNSQIMVRSRFQKDPMPLIASPFANDLGECVVYIDEGHTRGTDLSLPANTKGAVTLGLGQTKDQTVQAAMRLRQLGTTQSVAFLAPPEVYSGIKDLRAAHGRQGELDSAVSSRDVVRWLLEQSCKANEQMMSLHLSQCIDFCRRTDILWQHSDYAISGHSLDKVLSVIRQEEQQTLEQMYGPRAPHEQATADNRIELASRQLQGFVHNVTQMARHGRPALSSALMEVEQEREVVLEVEHMREKESRARYTALTFPGLDAAIVRFIDTGGLDTQAAASVRAPVLQAFDYIGRTRIGLRFGIRATDSRLYVSSEFSRTVKANAMGGERDVVRPVNWILWSPSSETALIIIPEEADAVMPLLRRVSMPRVWLLAYTTPVTKSMMHAFHDISQLTVPRWPAAQRLPTWLGIEVGILSGRLYFSYSEYMPLLEWLGLLDPGNQALAVVGGGRGGGDKMLLFLQAWLAFRRQSEDVLHTPVGFVCQRQRLDEGHYFFSGVNGGATGARAAIESEVPHE